MRRIDGCAVACATCVPVEVPSSLGPFCNDTPLLPMFYWHSRCPSNTCDSCSVFVQQRLSPHNTFNLMNPIVSLRVDDELRELGRFAVPEMSLSSSRADMLRHGFVLTISADLLSAYIEPTYAAWVADSRIDDEKSGSPQDELAEAGYPDASELVKSPSLLRLVIGSYLLDDVLGKLTWDRKSPIEYWLDSVTDCEVMGNEILLSGVCYSRAQ